MKQLGICIGSLIELKFCDFKNLISTDDAEALATSGLFYIQNISWQRINKTYIDGVIDKNLSQHFTDVGVVKSNFGNMNLVNPNYPSGHGATITIERLLRAKTVPFSLQNNVIGDFTVHDSGIWSDTEKTIPQGFFEGKFYYPTGKIYK